MRSSVASPPLVFASPFSVPMSFMLCMFPPIVVFFFFSSRRRHTRSKRDWSSDVCSSDLLHREGITRSHYPCFRRSKRQRLTVPHPRDPPQLDVAMSHPGGERSWGKPPSAVQPLAIAFRHAQRSEERRVGHQWQCRATATQ